jgi:hypothetical protein
MLTFAGIEHFSRVPKYAKIDRSFGHPGRFNATDNRPRPGRKILKLSPRFSEMRWQTRAEYNQVSIERRQAPSV